MVDWTKVRNWVRIGLPILVVGAFFGLIAVVARLILGDFGISVVDIAITGVLTAALVYLYFQQTTILESQRDLFTQQLNREARQHHTEVLRELVKKWHGNPERKPPEHVDESPLENLPTVTGTSIKSAKNVGLTIEWSGRDEKEFHTVPRELRNDPYFEDLLDNHATDLGKTKRKIEELQSEFEILRQQFLDQYKDGMVRDYGDYRLEPDSLLGEWIFDLVVLSARGRLCGDDTILDRAISDIETNRSSPLVPDESKLKYYAGREGTPVYSAVIEQADDEKLREYRDEVEQKVMGTVEKVVDNIDDEEPYSYARDAAGVLDSAEQEVNKLDELLIEYYGRPIYSGDCKYLQEARI